MSCVWHVALWQKCGVQKNSKFPISAEAQPSAEVAHVKCSLYESALLFDFLGREVHDVGKHGAL